MTQTVIASNKYGIGVWSSADHYDRLMIAEGVYATDRGGAFAVHLGHAHTEVFVDGYLSSFSGAAIYASATSHNGLIQVSENASVGNWVSMTGTPALIALGDDTTTGGAVQIPTNNAS